MGQVILSYTLCVSTAKCFLKMLLINDVSKLGAYLKKMIHRKTVQMSDVGTSSTKGTFSNQGMRDLWPVAQQPQPKQILLLSKY